MTKKLNIFFLFIVILIILVGVIFQSSLQHWSGQWDLDFWYIYNASLMSSGYQQEWFDHPATTILTFYSLFYKLYSLFDTNFIYQLDLINLSSDPDQILQKLYFVTRIIDSLNLIIIITFLFKILKIFLIKDFYSYVLISILIISKTFFNNFSILNPEDWSVSLFLISFYYFIYSFKINSINLLFISGIFFSLSFFSKISIIFLFLFIIPLIPLFFEIYNNQINEKILKYLIKNFNLIFFFYFILLITYFFVQIFLFSKFSLFEKNPGLDAFIIIFINLSYISFFFIYSKFNFEKIKIYFSLFLIFFSGFFTALLIFIFLDLINIVKLNPWVFFHLTNPFNEMIRFTSVGNISNLASSTTDFFGILFSNFIFNKFLFLILNIVFVISILIDIKKKNISYILLKLILFFCLIFNILLFNFRYFTEYSISVYIIYLIIFSVCLKNLSSKFTNFVSITLLSYVIILNPIINFETFKNILITRKSSLNILCTNQIDVFKNYSREFDQNTYEKICKSVNID